MQDALSTVESLVDKTFTLTGHLTGFGDDYLLCATAQYAELHRADRCFHVPLHLSQSLKGASGRCPVGEYQMSCKVLAPEEATQGKGSATLVDCTDVKRLVQGALAVETCGG